MSASLGWVGLAQWALRWSAVIWPRSGDEGTGLKLFEALGGDEGMLRPALQVAKALGARVTAISRGEKKRALALSHGADDFIDSKSPASLESGVASLDCIINVIPVYHDVTLYTPLLKPSTGKMYLIGITESTMAAFAADALLLGSSVITASLIGGAPRSAVWRRLCPPDTSMTSVRRHRLHAGGARSCQ